MNLQRVSPRFWRKSWAVGDVKAEITAKLLAVFRCFPLFPPPNNSGRPTKEIRQRSSADKFYHLCHLPMRSKDHLVDPDRLSTDRSRDALSANHPPGKGRV
jgi:hypothetical protein